MTLKFLKFLLYSFLTIYYCNVTIAQSNIQYDIVLVGGRVIDPEAKLDAIKNLGILMRIIFGIG
jgi:dihydroorotase